MLTSALKKQSPYLNFFFFSFLAAPQHMEFRGQGSDVSCNHDLSCSCGNAGSLTHCAGLGIEPATRRSQDTADPAEPQQELHILIFKIVSC